MRATHRSLAIAFAVALASACGGSRAPSSSAPPGAVLDPPPKPATGIQVHAGPWTVPPGQELNRCVVVRADGELLVSGIETWAAEHLHHFALTATPVNVGEGEADCKDILSDSVMNLSQTVFGTTRTHHKIDFPAGVAGKLSSGFTNLVISAHYVNPGTEPIVAEGYMNLTSTTKDRVKTLINGVLGRAHQFSISPRGTLSVTGRCVVDRGIDVLAIGSHAHARMVHEEIRLVRGGVRPDKADYVNDDWRTPLLDIFPDTPIHLNAGDAMEWTCDYVNEEDRTISEGSTAADEMCKGVLVYAPDQGYLTCDTSPDAPVKTVTQTTPPAQL